MFKAKEQEKQESRHQYIGVFKTACVLFANFHWPKQVTLLSPERRGQSEHFALDGCNEELETSVQSIYHPCCVKLW